jgi:hypothetical protein
MLYYMKEINSLPVKQLAYMIKINTKVTVPDFIWRIAVSIWNT